jgi:hypothetical protein
MSPTKMRALLVLDDGIAGHRSQALALAHALGGAIECFRFRLSPLAKLLAPRFIKAAMAQVDFEQAPGAFDAVISCGRKASAAAQALKRARPALKLIQILDPGGSLELIDILILPEHDSRQDSKVISTPLALHGINAAVLSEARAQFELAHGLQAPFHAFLVGAPSTQVPWNPAELMQSIEHAGQHARLLITSSRRTPKALRTKLAAWQNRSGHYFFDPVSTVSNNPYLGILASAARITVTADSINMISEAAATTAPLEILGSAQARGKFARFHARLRALERLSAKPPIEPINPMPEVASEVLSRLKWALQGSSSPRLL